MWCPCLRFQDDPEEGAEGEEAGGDYDEGEEEGGEVMHCPVASTVLHALSPRSAIRSLQPFHITRISACSLQEVGFETDPGRYLNRLQAVADACPTKFTVAQVQAARPVQAPCASIGV